MTNFTIPGEPQGKARARVVNVQGQARAYTPEKTTLYENLIKMAYYSNSKVKTDEPVQVNIKAYMQIPQSISKKKQNKMANGTIRPTKKPDLDNIAKVVCDALNGIAWNDDKQVIDLHIVKYYDLAPRVEVEITEVTANGKYRTSDS